jgi:hypothetical protein
MKKIPTSARLNHHGVPTLLATDFPDELSALQDGFVDEIKPE